MSFKGVNINKINGGPGGESAGRVAVMVTGCGTVGDTPEVNRACELLQLADAETPGITEARDESAGRLDHCQLPEVFRLSPDTRIWLTAVPAETKAGDLKNIPAFVSALRSTEGINTVAVSGTANETGMTGGITGMQIPVDDLARDRIYIDAVLFPGDGSCFAGLPVADYPDLREVECPNVSVIIGRDTAVAAKSAAAAGHAAVGAALGMLTVRAVHENPGSVDIETKPGSRKGEQDYSLSDVKTGKWMSASLSNGRNFNGLSQADRNRLNEPGCIHACAFAGYAGYYFSNSHTCDESGSDCCYIEHSAVRNRAARIIRRTPVPRIRSKVETGPATGFIKQTTITGRDGRVRKAPEPVRADRNCAGFDIYINPEQPAAVSFQHQCASGCRRRGS